MPKKRHKPEEIAAARAGVTAYHALTFELDQP